ncbi:lipase [Holotrichia oblita]|uniref:Lipase n=1 Tax=Holotrichia oblita TaxID=644536 RepID=A0ACB9T486_HOLOL|nr:lipase [Holotrichia oblita]
MDVLLKAFIILANETAIQSGPREPTSYNNYLLEVGVEMKEEKCYGSYGCYNLNPPWTSDHRPVSMFPEALEKVQPKYPFYNNQHPSKPVYLDLNEPEIAYAANLDAKLPLFIVSHGFTEDGDKEWMNFLRKKCNVIIVDWGTASSPPYTQAVANIRLAGTVTAHLIENISPAKRNGILEGVHCIGHSLGAHLCGYAGYTLQKRFNLTLGRITGMDPAEPHFAKNKPPVRLDRSAAVYVDVIHTDASGFTSAGFGIIESIGHVDFYPNGGSRQPGCTQSVFEYISLEKSVFNGVKKFLGCNHLRSYELFTETINPKVGTIGITCPSYKEFQAGKCFNCTNKGSYCLPFGFNSYEGYKNLIQKRMIQPRKNLVLYLLTEDATPFCKGHYKIVVNVSNTEESKLHRGEIGTLWFTVHTTTDGTGPKSNKIPLKDEAYHEPGSSYSAIVAGNVVDKIKSVEVEFQYHTNVINPLTWRMFAAPRLYLSKIRLENLETNKAITVCPKDDRPLISSMPQIMLPTYCT